MFNLFKKRRKQLKGKRNINYGLSLTTPVCVSGGPAEGANNEKQYLSRLRCPGGKPVNFERRGSVNPESEKLMMEMQDNMGSGIKEPEKDPLELFGRIFGKSIDIYDVRCTCGKNHNTVVYINMYEEGLDNPIGLAGWTLKYD